MEVLIQMGKLNIVFLLTFYSFLYAVDTLKPTYTLMSSGDVQDIVYKNNKLYSATSEGIIDIFDTKTKKRIQKINLPNIMDFMGDEVPSKIYSIDILNDKLLIVAQGMKGYRNMWLFDKQLEKAIDITKKLFIKEARFVDENSVILATLSNQIIYFDLKNKKQLYSVQISPSSFSDFALSEDKTKIIATDESGIVRIIDTKSGNIVKKAGDINLDRVYQLDFKNGVILTAGQDRKAVVYKNNKSDSIDFKFLLYSCGLSPSGKVGAVAYNEQNDVAVIDTNSMDILYSLIENKATLTKILFISESELFSTSDNEQINFYKF